MEFRLGRHLNLAIKSFLQKSTGPWRQESIIIGLDSRLRGNDAVDEPDHLLLWLRLSLPRMHGRILPRRFFGQFHEIEIIR